MLQGVYPVVRTCHEAVGEEDDALNDVVFRLVDLLMGDEGKESDISAQALREVALLHPFVYHMLLAHFSILSAGYSEHCVGLPDLYI